MEKGPSSSLYHNGTPSAYVHCLQNYFSVKNNEEAVVNIYLCSAWLPQSLPSLKVLLRNMFYLHNGEEILKRLSGLGIFTLCTSIHNGQSS